MQTVEADTRRFFILYFLLVTRLLDCHQLNGFRILNKLSFNDIPGTLVGNKYVLLQFGMVVVNVGNIHNNRYIR